MKRRYVVLSLTAVLALALAVPAFGGPTNIVSALTKVKKTANKALKQAQAANTPQPRLRPPPTRLGPMQPPPEKRRKPRRRPRPKA